MRAERPGVVHAAVVALRGRPHGPAFQRYLRWLAHTRDACRTSSGSPPSITQPVTGARQLKLSGLGKVCLNSEGSATCQTIQIRDRMKERVQANKAVNNPDKNRVSNPINRATYPTSRKNAHHRAEMRVTNASRTNRVVSVALLSNRRRGPHLGPLRF